MHTAIGHEGGARPTGGGFCGAFAGLMQEPAVAMASEQIVRIYGTPADALPGIRIEQASAAASLLQQ